MREEPIFDVPRTTGRAPETVFFDGGGITVTNTRFVVPGQTYAMASVTSVRYLEKPQSWVMGAVCGALAIWWLTIGTFMIPLVVVFAGISSLALWRGRPRYDVILSTAAGEVRALSSHERGDVRQVVKALNDAIIFRG